MRNSIFRNCILAQLVRSIYTNILCSTPLYTTACIKKKNELFLFVIYAGINVLCGIGLLTTPYAIREGGWLSLILLAFFGVICCYTGILLKRCLESCPGLRTYPDIGQAAFGSAGRFFLSVSPTLQWMLILSDCELQPSLLFYVWSLNIEAKLTLGFWSCR